MRNNEKKYYLGLDVGTNSVGWCITDDEYNVVRIKGKHLWGVRLFEESRSAKERRAYRTSRRRTRRKKERIDLLRQLLAEEINKADPTFYQRLDESFFDYDDRTNKNLTTLFVDKDFTDKEFFAKFPTIFHLRKFLMENSCPNIDPRYLYLAISNMLKHRGNFLQENFDVSNVLSEEILANLIGEINDEFADQGLFGTRLNYDSSKFSELQKAFDGNNRISDLKILLENIFEIAKSDEYNLLKKFYIPLFAGGSVKFTVFNDIIENIKDDPDIKSISFDDINFDENYENLLSKYGDYENYFLPIKNIKTIYDAFKLNNLLGQGNKSISIAMCNLYDEYSKDLKALKSFVNKYYPKRKFEIFKKQDDKLNNYACYTGFNISLAKRTNTKKCSLDAFYDFLNKTLNIKSSEHVDDPDYERITSRMATKKFLKKQRTNNNGMFPYQLNEYELKAILEKQSEVNPWLNNKDEDGYVLKDKLLSLLTFKIPYYVGPLYVTKNAKENSYAWVEREEGKIYPWNFSTKVKLDLTAEKFINRMQNKCTYLNDQYCLPKNSIILSYFNVLEFLNKINVNGSLISLEDRDDIINHLFLKNKKVTPKMLSNFFKYKHGENVVLTTSNDKSIDQINCNMSSYFLLSKIFGEDFIANNIDLVEDVIKDLTIFEDKSIIEKRLATLYGFNIEQIKKLKNLNFKDFGRISKKLLVGIKDEEDNLSIIKHMKMSNMNFMEVINNPKFKFVEMFDKYNKENCPVEQNIDDFIDGLYVPKMSHRAIKQVYLIVEELKRILNERKISKYFIEFTRTNKAEKVKKSSRYDWLKTIYHSAKQLNSEISKEQFKSVKERLENIESDKLKSEKYFLYFTQCGISMYSGKPIDFEALVRGDKYDVDHIVPQSLVKDDSLDNKVLVEKELNAVKSDTYPINQNMLWNGNYKAAYAFYEYLKKSGLITERKFSKLLKKEFTLEELDGFINRQKVITDQSTKGIVEMLHKFMKVDSTDIVYSKGENVSDFRHIFDIPKSRLANNSHHAHDAYLNIVVGNIFDRYFKFRYVVDAKTLEREFKEKKLSANESFLLKKDKLWNIEGEIIWNKQDDIKKIKHYIEHCHDVFLTIRPYIGNEILHKVTIQSKGDNLYPVKYEKPYINTSKYGGFNNLSYSCYMIVKCKNEVRLMPKAPFINKNLKDEDDNLLLSNLKINTVLQDGDKKFMIRGATGGRFVISTLNDRIFDYKHINTINKIEKVFKNKLISKDTLINPAKLSEIYFYDKELNRLVIAKSDAKILISIDNDELISLYEDFIGKFSKKTYSYSNILKMKTLLEQSRDKFITLTIGEKIYLISEILKLIKVNENNGADLQLIGGSEIAGKLYISSSLKQGTKIIYESVTGFYSYVKWVVK